MKKRGKTVVRKENKTKVPIVVRKGSVEEEETDSIQTYTQSGMDIKYHYYSIMHLARFINFNKNYSFSVKKSYYKVLEVEHKCTPNQLRKSFLKKGI